MAKSAPRLSEVSRTIWEPRVACYPQYDRRVSPGVVHLGLGGFHRAHQAVVFDRLLGQGDPRWAVVGVGMTRPDLVKQLAMQDGLYALHVQSAQGAHWQVPGALVAWEVAISHSDAVIERMAAGHTRWVTITVTEKGYGPVLFDLLLAGLSLRRRQGMNGITVASCDNLISNGDRLRTALQTRALARGQKSLWTWIERHCAFPCSLVDRIVPATSLDGIALCQRELGVRDETVLETEAFGQWVIENHFADPTDARSLAAWGVDVTDRVWVYEQAKLGMLNGSHTALAMVGLVAGIETIGQAMAVKPIRAFIDRFMMREVAPHMARQDCAGYRDQLMARFDNPHLRHRLAQIAKDTSQKISPRWLPTLRAARAAGSDLSCMAFAAAAFVHWCSAIDERGQSYAIDDPMQHQLGALVRDHTDLADRARALLGVPEIWAELSQDSVWISKVIHQARTIASIGIVSALSALQGTAP